MGATQAGRKGGVVERGRHSLLQPAAPRLDLEQIHLRPLAQLRAAPPLLVLRQLRAQRLHLLPRLLERRPLLAASAQLCRQVVACHLALRQLSRQLGHLARAHPRPLLGHVQLLDGVTRHRLARVQLALQLSALLRELSHVVVAALVVQLALRSLRIRAGLLEREAQLQHLVCGQPQQLVGARRHGLIATTNPLHLWAEAERCHALVHRALALSRVERTPASQHLVGRGSARHRALRTYSKQMGLPKQSVLSAWPRATLLVWRERR